MRVKSVKKRMGQTMWMARRRRIAVTSNFQSVERRKMRARPKLRKFMA